MFQHPLRLHGGAVQCVQLNAHCCNQLLFLSAQFHGTPDPSCNGCHYCTPGDRISLRGDASGSQVCAECDILHGNVLRSCMWRAGVNIKMHVDVNNTRMAVECIAEDHQDCSKQQLHLGYVISCNSSLSCRTGLRAQAKWHVRTSGL